MNSISEKKKKKIQLIGSVGALEGGQHPHPILLLHCMNIQWVQYRRSKQNQSQEAEKRDGNKPPKQAIQQVNKKHLSLEQW